MDFYDKNIQLIVNLGQLSKLTTVEPPYNGLSINRFPPYDFAISERSTKGISMIFFRRGLRYEKNFKKSIKKIFVKVGLNRAIYYWENGNLKSFHFFPFPFKKKLWEKLWNWKLMSLDWELTQNMKTKNKSRNYIQACINCCFESIFEGV